MTGSVAGIRRRRTVARRRETPHLPPDRDFYGQTLVRLKDDFRCGHPLVSQELFNEWFNMNFYMIKSEKLQGVKRPVPSRPKGFWKSLFG